MMYIAQIWTKIDMLYNIHYLYLKQVITIVTEPHKHPKNKVFSSMTMKVGLDVNK